MGLCRRPAPAAQWQHLSTGKNRGDLRRLALARVSAALPGLIVQYGACGSLPGHRSGAPGPEGCRHESGDDPGLFKGKGVRGQMEVRVIQGSSI